MIESCDYKPSLRPSVLALAGREEAGERIWEWQFEDNPRGLPFRPVVLRDSASGQVVGFNGVMPVRVHYRGSPMTGCWSCDFHVRADVRGQGIGRQVKETLHGRYDLLMTFGVSASAARVLPRVGWQPSDQVRSYRRLYRPGRRGDWLRMAAQTLNRAVHWLTRRRKEAKSLTIKRTSKLPPAGVVDDLWHRVCQGYEKIVCRDYTYLDWRYQRCPVGRYRFILIYDQSELRAIAVYRHEGSVSRLVDLLAARDDEEVRGTVIDNWLDATAIADVHSLVTSDQALCRQAKSRGFFRGSGSPGFFVRSSLDEDTPETGWFIMAGDSDGEFLQAAWDAQQRENAPELIEVYQLTPDECFAKPTSWQELVQRSDVNPLFMGWEWQSAWWRTWQEQLALEPLFLAAYAGQRLVALAPCYCYWRKLLPGYWVKELHLVGNAPGIAPTVRTEYTDILVDPAYRVHAARALSQALQRIDWHTFTVCDYVAPGYLQDCLPQLPGTRMQQKRDWGARLPTTGSFAHWLSSLSHNTRRQMYNQRRHLADNGTSGIALRFLDSRKGLATLNHFHCQRWGRPAFGDEAEHFHSRFLEQLPAAAAPQFRALEVDGTIVSVLYDVRFNDRVYNLQMGFDESFDARLSLGTLHLGYAIEDAFADPSVNAYDFLAGGGKKTHYKSRFRGDSVAFDSFCIVRSNVLKIAYHTYYQLPRQWQQTLGRWTHVRARPSSNQGTSS